MMKSNVTNNLKNDKDVNENTINVFIFEQKLSVGELAKKINVLPSKIIKYFFLQQKKMVTINQILNFEAVNLVCSYLGLKVEDKSQIVKNNINKKVEIVDKNVKNKNLSERPPIITIMGHVDHGKTTLIDTIRKSNIASQEAGGISQVIGAYQKEINGKKITFIDTPGHEAFKMMRYRGASITDIIVLIVAADDGVKPQTIEVINLAKNNNIPIIVAINKIDKDTADIEKVKNELMNYEIIPEEYGGKNIFCEISAKQNIGIDNLIDNIILLSDILELKADQNCNASGTVLESYLSKNEGPMATLLVQNGVLKNNNYIVIGSVYGHIRKMVDEHHKNLKTAGPSTPILITGLSEVPNVGEYFSAFVSEKEAKLAISKQPTKNNNEINNDLSDLNDAQMNNILFLIIRADSISSVEVICDSVKKINVPGTQIKIIRAMVGTITDNDLSILTNTSNNVAICGFNIKLTPYIKTKIKEMQINVCLHNVIYALVNDVEMMLKKLIKPKMKQVITGCMEIRKIFTFSKINIAGCYVLNGCIKLKSKIHLIRNNKVIHDGEIISLKHRKDNITEAKSGSECGAVIANYNDIHEKDIIESYELVEEK